MRDTPPWKGRAIQYGYASEPPMIFAESRIQLPPPSGGGGSPIAPIMGISLRAGALHPIDPPVVCKNPSNIKGSGSPWWWWGGSHQIFGNGMYIEGKM